MKKLSCFVIGPIGQSGSEKRTHADWLFEGIVKPAMLALPKFDQPIRADKISKPGMITTQVIELLLDSDLVIADMSLANANAFYEIGIRHMVQKPIIHMQLDNEEIPFDVGGYRAIRFSLKQHFEILNAQENLRLAIEEVLADGYVVENPITFSRGQIKVEQHATPAQRILLEQLALITSRLDDLESETDRSAALNYSYRNSKKLPKFERGTLYVYLRPISEGDLASMQSNVIAVVEENLKTTWARISAEGVSFEFEMEPTTLNDIKKTEALLKNMLAVRDVRVTFDV